MRFLLYALAISFSAGRVFAQQPKAPAAGTASVDQAGPSPGVEAKKPVPSSGAAPGAASGTAPVAGSPSTPAAPAAAAPAAAAAKAGASGTPDLVNDPNALPPSSPPSLFAGFMDPFDYDPRGRRDPFSQPVADKPMSQGNVHGPLLPLQQFDLRQLKLTGIIWNVNNPKAMIKDPNGTVHVVGPNAKVGPRNGYVAVIREGEIVVVETMDQEGHLVSTAQVVRLAK